MADAFEKLFTDNKNGAVMRVATNKEGVGRAEYVTNEWKA